MRGGSRLGDYYTNYCHQTQARGEDSVTFEEFSAHFIQSWWHRVYSRHRPHHVSMESLSPTKSAASAKTKSVSIVLSPETGIIRGDETTSQQPTKKDDGKGQRRRKRTFSPNEAAIIIQQTWRRHIDVQVYRYYRDLINFRCRGDPSMMLRCINPKEATLLDSAAGIHIKFRLAGAKFPPNIYYKIFTHRTIIDMCANSPKDYTAAPTKRFAARDIHNRRELPAEVKVKGQSSEEDRSGWYQRIENNGWRLVSDRLILRADQDSVTWESSKKKVDFSHSKLKRKDDVEKKKKRKKLEWMKKMYKDGMLKARGDDGMKTMVENATEGMIAEMEVKQPELVDDWEVDELLQWTSGLNFDDYQKSWQEIGTSAGSESYTNERLQFRTSQQDPFEFSLTRNSLPSPPSPSRVTTAKSRSAKSNQQLQEVPVN